MSEFILTKEKFLEAMDIIGESMKKRPNIVTTIDEIQLDNTSSRQAVNSIIQGQGGVHPEFSQVIDRGIYSVGQGGEHLCNPELTKHQDKFPTCDLAQPEYSLLGVDLASTEDIGGITREYKLGIVAGKPHIRFYQHYFEEYKDIEILEAKEKLFNELREKPQNFKEVIEMKKKNEFQFSKFIKGGHKHGRQVK